MTCAEIPLSIWNTLKILFCIAYTVDVTNRFALGKITYTAHFFSGMGGFAVAHLLYSLAFLSSNYAAYPSSSWKRVLYLILFMVGGGFYIIIYPYLKKDSRSDLLIPAVGIYVILIPLM